MAPIKSMTRPASPTTISTTFQEQDDHDDDVDEIAFEEPGDLGISVRVDATGAVIVSNLRQLRGYAELSCPTLHGGDVLVAIDSTPIVDLSFADVMLRLHATVNTRPTRLEFLGVDRFASADAAVQTWRHQTRQQLHPHNGTSGTTTTSSGSHVDDDPRFREGEFDVSFASQQPTGLRFSEGYIMTHALQLAHVETALLVGAMACSRSSRDALRRSLLQTILVRIGDDSVLGAPVDDVMALLYDAASFPKTLWLARAQHLQNDYQVVTLHDREQLKWLCFVPVERMMEVPVVSYAALATDQHDNANPDPHPNRKRTRSDGIREDQYLLAINGFPTLRLSVASFSDAATSNESTSHSRRDSGASVVSMATTSLDTLLDQSRTLRFRDLKAYRREFLAHEPLSPWQRRRRRTTTTNTSSSTSTSTSASASPIATATMMSTTARHQDKGELLDHTLSSLAERFDVDDDPHQGRGSVGIAHYSGCFTEILKQQAHTDDYKELLESQELPESQETEDMQAKAASSTQSSSPPQRPIIKRYRGLANCEGTRSFTPVVPDNLKTVVIPDNRRHVGIQLETDVLLPSGRPVVRQFVRRDGPALQSRRVRVGDRLLSVNGVAIEEIPTDMLIRILHGEDECMQTDHEGDALSTPPASHGDAHRKRGVSADSTRRRVLKIARKSGNGAPQLQQLQDMMSHARRFLIASTSRLSFWPSEATASHS